VAERLFDHGVVLPSGSVLRDGDIDRVVGVLHEVLA
jgi:dTDP-4-amino-4,6-dideoxygalactose transaminase